MKLHYAAALALLIPCWTFLGSPPLQAEAPNAEAQKVERLLKANGYEYKTHNPTVWSVELKRKNLGTVLVITSVGSGLVVTFAILAKKAAIQKTPELMQTLLHANGDYDYVKILFDGDDDLLVRIDTSLRLIDATELKNVVEQVANASDELFPRIAGSIKR